MFISLMIRIVCAVLWLTCVYRADSFGEVTYRGYVEYETYQFPERQPNETQVKQNQAAKLRVEANWQINDQWQVRAQPFVRYDFIEKDRNVARVDDLWIEYAQPNWDIRIGNQLVPWGSMESVSPVNVLNQIDFQEDVFARTRMGTPMGRLRFQHDKHAISLFYLPYYLPPEVPEQHNFYSFSGGLPLNLPKSHWENQFAARYLYAGEGVDIAFSYFRGIEQNLLLDFDPVAGTVSATTYRSQRFGVEATKVFGQLLLKGEAVYRMSADNRVDSGFLYAGGIEYTFPSFWRHSDVAVFAEYLGSSTNVTTLRILQNAAFLGIRWSLNDVRRQQFQFLLLQDVSHSQSHAYRIEYSGSLTDKISLNASYTNTLGLFSDPNRDEDRSGAFRLYLRFNF